MAGRSAGKGLTKPVSALIVAAGVSFAGVAPVPLRAAQPPNFHATKVTVERVWAETPSTNGSAGVRGASQTKHPDSVTVPTEGVPALLKDGVFSAPVQMMAP